MKQQIMNGSIIVARSRNGVIGKNDSSGKQIIPWQGELPADMTYFQDVTFGHAVIMGRKTYESLPPKLTPLKGRLNIIISRNSAYDPRTHSEREDYDPNQVSVQNGIGAAMTFAAEHGFWEPFIIGGGEIYAEAFKHPRVTRVFITEIDQDFEGDVIFPGEDLGMFHQIKSWRHEPFDKNLHPFSWDVYEGNWIYGSSLRWDVDEKKWKAPKECGD